MNYQQELEKTLMHLESALPLQKRPRLLLHVCCAPCSSFVLELLSSFFDITLFYYNPNIYPIEEYTRRLEELKKFLPLFAPAKENSVKIIEENYNPKDFYDAIEIDKEPILAEESEKGERCRRCYAFRLKHAFFFAEKNGFDYFCTTLSISPFKDAVKINTEGEYLSTQGSGKTKWLFSDFKKKNGFLRSLELSEQYGLYRQKYCGCIYSARHANTTPAQQVLI